MAARPALQPEFERPRRNRVGPRAAAQASGRTFPELGWPRETDSLCPKCVKEVRSRFLDGERDISTLIDGKPGEIRARSRRGRQAQDGEECKRTAASKT